MFRLRRYRVYMALAAVALLLLYRMSLDADWNALPTSIDYTSSSGAESALSPEDRGAKSNGVVGDLDLRQKQLQEQQRPLNGEHKEETSVKIPDLKEDGYTESQADFNLPTTTRTKAQPTAQDKSEANESAETTDTPVVVAIPDRKTPHQTWDKQLEKENAEKLRQGGQQLESKTTSTSVSTTHWAKPTEVFPVAPESLIALPTGKPKAIPKIQHQFKQESSEARTKREDRLDKVKAEMRRAWTGYKTHAWMHDELSPVTQKFRDPFCGWAATLVDALDTLWIMGMKEEFEEAVKAVGDIDFTTATRSEIPVFETTIRYLGGLLGAYDVSGARYEILLDKAVELAEILMGVFDTPNRMPVLYYNWQPAHMGKPRRASAAANVAEMGSLSMEFTRLAQLTKENKYYDAVARITDAFEEWQSRPGGTVIPGIFSENVDASGCNRTAARDAELKLSEEQAKKVQSLIDTPDDYTGREYGQDGKSSTGSPKGAGSTPKSKPKPNSKGVNKRAPVDTTNDDVDPHDRPLTVKTSSDATNQKPTAPEIPSAPDLYQQMRVDKVTGEPYSIPQLGAEVCYPQGLTAGGWGMSSFSMGGSQDSTYEYFPKQFLLLGALEPKYRDMHLKVVKAVKEWLLYRPMVPNDRDILFSAKITSMGDPKTDVITEFEVTHLTCFLGGMFAMGGKVFEDAVDVEIGKKLTDGCVWAYESMPSGIMPEGATVVPCAETGSCPYNETLWHQYLDPLWNTRDAQLEDYYKRKEEAEKLRLEQALQEKQEELRRDEASPTEADDEDRTNKSMETGSAKAVKRSVVTASKEKDSADKEETSSNDNSPPTKTTKTVELEDSLGFSVGGGSRRVNSPAKNKQTPLNSGPDDGALTLNPDPLRPLSHEEYVKNRITNENIPPGFVNVAHRHYILRPEAIESVWYMYRITGDKYWQDKGWKMFEAIIAATQNEAGHSAIQDVLVAGSAQSNEMESFWLAETLKYFYLLYTTPDVISLDDYVLNTEAHPFKRPVST